MQPKESKTNWHFQISLIKSIARIIAGTLLIIGHIEACGIFLIGAELLGIAEEL